MTRAQGAAACVVRHRKRVVYDRLLARLLAVAEGQWLLKRGVAREPRLSKSTRATKDINLDSRADKRRLGLSAGQSFGRESYRARK